MISDFESIKESSLAHQIVKAGRLINEQGIARIKKKLSLKTLTKAHLELFSYIEFEGSSVSDIAKKKGVSKQSVSVLANQLIEMGLCYFTAEKEDKRKKLLKFHTSGDFSIFEGMKELTSLDEILKTCLTSEEQKKCLKSLSKIIDLMQKQ